MGSSADTLIPDLGLQNYDSINFCCFKLPGLWFLAAAPDTVCVRGVLQADTLGDTGRSGDSRRCWPKRATWTFLLQAVGSLQNIKGHMFEREIITLCYFQLLGPGTGECGLGILFSGKAGGGSRAPSRIRLGRVEAV